MLALLIIVILATLFVSALCSLLEGFILSITTAEIESLKHLKPKAGLKLEQQKQNIEQTTAAILTLNTLVNVGGSSICGYLSGKLFNSTGVAILTFALTLIILFFCEILPKNAGILFRKQLSGLFMPALSAIVLLMSPIANLCKGLINLILPKKIKATEEDREQEILLLVNKGHKDGFFSLTEREIISNTFKLDDFPITKVMTPLERITAISAEEHVCNAIHHIGKTTYSRLPVYQNSKIVGIVYRTDLLQAGAADKHDSEVSTLMRPVLRIESNLTPADILQSLLKNKEKMCIVENSGQALGLVTMRDIIEHLLGQKTR